MTLVSVVIPCFNQAHLMAEAIESVASQSYEPIETIVVDDGSTDGTFAVARGYGVRCIRQKNRGVAGARNTGMRASKGNFLLFLDSDDLLAHDSVEAGVSCLKRHRDVAFVFGRPDVVGLAPGVAPRRVETDFYRSLLEGNYIWMPGLVLFRRWAFDAVKGFDLRLNGGADYDLYLRITRRFPVAFCAEMHGTYRRHGASMSNDSARMFRDTSAALRSQRRHVNANKEYRDAYRRGIENLRQAYGRWAVIETGRQIGSGELRPAASNLAILLRYDLRGFPSAVLGGLRQAATALVRKGRGSSV
jgi:glycosyltransferase involved in cell wall biosynthesis